MNLTQAILPVAGLGTRFLPWTKVVPKELLPIGNEPIIAKLVEECVNVGITDICLVISKGKELLPEYFKRDAVLEAELAKRGKEEIIQSLNRFSNVKIHVVYQHEQLGDGHAILQAADWVTSGHVAVLFGDDLIVDPASKEQTGLKQLAAAMNTIADASDAAMLCLQNVDRSQTGKYGIVSVDADTTDRLKKITGLVEKPKPEEAPSTLGIVGKYIIPRSTLEALPHAKSSKGGEIRLIDALIHQLKDISIYGYECEGMRLDTGTPEGYKEAVRVLG